MSKVEIYTTFLCGYCAQAKNFLKKNGIEFVEIDVSYDHKEREKMIQRAGGKYTVPQIFIDGNSIGGYDEMIELENNSSLRELLE